MMLPILKRVAIGVGLATILVIAVGFVLPASYSVSRSITINAEPAHIHRLVNDLEKWPDWTPWLAADPSIEVTLGPVTAGVGAHQSWTGNSGGGALTFTRSDSTSGIEYDMSMDGDKYRSVGAISYQTDEAGTKVIWTMTGENGNNPLNRYFGLMMEPMVGPMFEDGLNRLKLAAERTYPAATPDSATVGAPADTKGEYR